MEKDTDKKKETAHFETHTYIGCDTCGEENPQCTNCEAPIDYEPFYCIDQGERHSCNECEEKNERKRRTNIHRR